MPLPPVSDFAFQMRELIQQETPMVGFQRGMDFLTNFPDFLPGSARAAAAPLAGGTAPAAVPPMQPSQPAPNSEGRQHAPQTAHGGPEAVPRGGPSQNGASRQPTTSSSHRAVEEKEDMALMRAAIGELKRLEGRVLTALKVLPVSAGTEVDVMEATDIATRCLSWRDRIKSRVAQDIPPVMLAELLDVNDDLNAVINRWQATYGKYMAVRPQQQTTDPAKPAEPRQRSQPLIDISPPQGPSTPVPGGSGIAAAAGRFWDTLPPQGPVPATPSPSMVPEGNPQAFSTGLPPQALSGGGLAPPPLGGSGVSGAGSEAWSESGATAAVSGVQPPAYASGRSIQELEAENAGLRKEVAELHTKLAESSVDPASSQPGEETNGQDLARRVEEMASAEERLVLEVRTLRWRLQEKDAEIEALKAHIHPKTADTVRTLVRRASTQLTEVNVSLGPMGQNPSGQNPSGQNPFARHSAPIMASEAQPQGEGPSWKSAEAEQAAAFEGLGEAGPMKAYYKQPALRLMSPNQFRALSSSLTQPLGARLDALRME
eukprot:jgi/Botrbrau1/1054/Bobra.0076s0020.1